MKSILIIGGTGFFGKSFLHSFVLGDLKQFGIGKVIIVARRTDLFKKSYSQLINENVELVQLDITNCVTIPQADIVVHAASSTDARDYLSDAKGQKYNIETSTVNYSKLAAKFHSKAKIVYCSSGAVYGQQPENVEALDEEFPFQDVSELVEHKRDYALGKRLSEKEIKKLGESGLNVSIARCFAFYGKYLPRDQHFAYGNFLGAAERGEPIEVKANHQVFRSYMHADDLVHSLIKIALDANPSCPIYNVGSEEVIEIRELAKMIGRQYNLPVKIAPITNNHVDRYVPKVVKLNLLMNAR